LPSRMYCLTYRRESRARRSGSSRRVWVWWLADVEGHACTPVRVRGAAPHWGATHTHGTQHTARSNANARAQGHTSIFAPLDTNTLDTGDTALRRGGGGVVLWLGLSVASGSGALSVAPHTCAHACTCLIIYSYHTD
jgi:hypothetical protein